MRVAAVPTPHRRLLRIALIVALAATSVVAGCSEHVEMPPPCDEGASFARAMPSSDSQPLYATDEIGVTLFIGDSHVVWQKFGELAIRHTDVATGTTTVLACRQQVGFSVPQYPSFSTPKVRTPNGFSFGTRAIRWTGDSVALYDPVARMMTVVSLADHRVRRVSADTEPLWMYGPTETSLRDRRFEVLKFVAPPAVALPNGVRRLVGYLSLWQRGVGREVARLPLVEAQEVMLTGAMGPMKLPTPDKWSSLNGVAPSRIAVTNASRDSVLLVSTTGVRHAVPLALPVFHLTPRARSDSFAAWLHRIPQLARDRKLQEDLARHLLAPDSVPSLARMVPTDSTTWLWLTLPANGDSLRLVLAEVDDRARVRRCAPLPGYVVAIGERRMLVARGSAAGIAPGVYVQDAPPRCYTSRLRELVQVPR